MISPDAQEAPGEPVARRPHYLYEIPVFYAALFALERLAFPENPSFYQIHPHPYWLGIVIFALRYGLGAGFFSGLVAAGWYLAGLWLRGERYLFEDADFYLLPGFFMIVGASMGNAINRYLDLLKAKQRQIEDMRAKNAAGVEALKLESKGRRFVEQQVVSQMSSLATLYAGARSLGSLEQGALMDGILDFFTQALKAQRSALYIKSDDRWILHAHRGYAHGDSPPQAADFGVGLIGRAGSQNKVASLRDFFPDLDKAWEARGQADALMACPLRGAKGEAIAVFCVTDMPFLRFNSASLNLLSLLEDWAEEAIAKCFYFEELKSQAPLDQTLHVYNEKYFLNQAKQAFEVSLSRGHPFGIVMVGIDGLQKLSGLRKLNALRIIAGLLTETCRQGDMVAKFPDPEIPFAILILRGKPEEAGARLTGVLKQGFEKIDVSGLFSNGSKPISMKIGLACYRAGTASLEAMLEEARRELK